MDTKEKEYIEVELDLFSHLPNKLDESHQNEAKEIVQKILMNYLNSPENKPLYFPSQLNSELRKIIHDIAESLSLLHKSKGSKASRKLVISKQANIPIKIDTTTNTNKSNKEFSDVPDPINKIWVEEATSNTISLKWEIPDCNGNKITMYIVTITRGSEKVLINSEKEEIIIPNLSPNTQYSISILAKNSEGLGYQGEVFKCRTLMPESLAGEVYVWGMLGDGYLPFNLEEVKNENKAVIRPTFANLLGNSVVLIKGQNTGVGIFSDGSAFRFGHVLIHDEEASEEQKSRNYINSGENEKIAMLNSDPYQIVFPAKTNIMSVSCGDKFSLALSVEGEVYSWGTNSFGELGIGTAIDCMYAIEPFKIALPQKTYITQIATGMNHSVALSDDSKIFVWGKCQAPYYKEYEEDALITMNKFSAQKEPRIIKETDLEGKPISIYAGGEVTGIINDKYELLLYGDNDMCQMGIGDQLKGHFHIPRVVESFKAEHEKKVLSVSIGFAHVLAIVEEKGKSNVYSWGLNKKGQCGQPSKNIIEYPTIISGSENIVEVSAGLLHSLFRDKEGGIWACGDASKGASGLTTELKGKFSTMAKLAKIPSRTCVKVIAGMNSSFAIMTEN